MRACGGIEVVMNHCVVDETNPCTSVFREGSSGLIWIIDLREHAIFALRNLLQDNVENQRVVQEFKPLRDFDKDGVLRNLGPEA